MIGASRGRPKGTGRKIGPFTPRTEATTEFGHLLREIRIAHNLTLRDFAVLVGYSETSFGNIQKYEVGEFFPPEIPVILGWMRTLGYDIFSDETRAIVRAALKDHFDEIAPGFARFIIEGER